jgi:hypothetical protein
MSNEIILERNDLSSVAFAESCKQSNYLGFITSALGIGPNTCSRIFFEQSNINLR